MVIVPKAQFIYEVSFCSFFSLLFYWTWSVDVFGTRCPLAQHPRRGVPTRDRFPVDIFPTSVFDLIEKNSKGIAVLLLNFSLISITAAQDKKLPTITLGYSAISGSFAPLWVGVDEGLFAKHGLEVRLTYMMGSIFQH